MGFWREHMPEGMLLRSGADWHLDAAGEATFEAYLEEQRLRAGDVDPIPLSLFLDYTDWFTRRKGLSVRDERVAVLTRGVSVRRGCVAHATLIPPSTLRGTR